MDVSQVTNILLAAVIAAGGIGTWLGSRSKAERAALRRARSAMTAAYAHIHRLENRMAHDGLEVPPWPDALSVYLEEGDI